MSALTDALELALAEARATEAQLQTRIGEVQSLTANVTTLTGSLSSASAEITRLQRDLTAARARIAELEALLPPPPPPVPTQIVYLSDLTPTGTPINGWGPYERDRSNGGQASGDGGPIRLRGTTYQKGLGVHARSVLAYNLAGLCNRFRAVIGIDDFVPATNTTASVTFRVLGDGNVLYTSPALTRASAPVAIDIAVAGAQRLQLEVIEGISTASDHADWANAHLTFATQAMLNQFLLLNAGGSGGTTPPPDISIGTVSVAGGGQWADGDTVTLTASRSGNAGDVQWAWAVPAGSGITPSTTSTQTFTMSAGRAGTFTVTATSSTARDTPRTGQAVISLASGGGTLQPLSIPGWSITPSMVGLAGAGVDGRLTSEGGDLTLYNGPLVIPANTVLDRYLFRGPIRIINPGIVVQRCRFAPTTFIGIPLIECRDRDAWRATVHSSIVQNCEFTGGDITVASVHNGNLMSPQQQRSFIAAYWGPGTFRRNFVTRIGGGIAFYDVGTEVDCIAEENYIGDPTVTGTYAFPGNQSGDGTNDMQGWGDWAGTGNHSSCGTFRDFRRTTRPDRIGSIRRNWFYNNGPTASGAFTMYSQVGPIDAGIVIEQNYFLAAGGNINLSPEPLPFGGVEIRDNRFEKPPGAWFPGAVTQGTAGLVWVDNYWINRAQPQARGALIPAP
jgi:hypothetical protein